MGKMTNNVDKQLNAAIYTLEKDAGCSDMMDELNAYYKGTLTKYVVLDFTRIEKHLTNNEIIKIADKMKLLGKARRGGYDIVVVRGLLQYGLARIYSAYTADADPGALRTIVLRSVDEALSWMRHNETFNKENKEK